LYFILQPSIFPIATDTGNIAHFSNVPVDKSSYLPGDQSHLKNLRFKIFIATVGAQLCFVPNLFGADRIPTFFVNFGGGLTTHKSEFVESNDTSYSYEYSFGVHAGSEDQLTMFINTAIDKTDFALNTSSIENEFQDSVLRYAFGPVYIGAIVSQTKMLISRVTDSPIEIDAIGTGFGGTLGGSFEFGREGGIFFDVASVTTSTVKEIHQEEFTIGSRMDMTLGGTYAITRSLINGLVGLRQRSYGVSLGGTSSTETVTTTWFGFAMNMEF
jgi:hypothetical protein